MTAAAAAAHAKGGAGIGAWIAGHHAAAIAGAGGLVAAYALYRSKKAGGVANTATGTTTSTPYTTAPYGTAGYATYDSSQLDAYNGLESQLTTLTGQLQGLQSASAAGATPVPTTTPTVTAPPNYTQVSKQAALADVGAGQTLYQSGNEAIGWDTTYGTPKGQSIGAVNPNSYYALSPAAARLLANSGKPVYAL